MERTRSYSRLHGSDAMANGVGGAMNGGGPRPMAASALYLPRILAVPAAPSPPTASFVGTP